MKYTIEILQSAQKQLSRIDSRDQGKIIEAIRALADSPRPPGCMKLFDRPGWRIRVGVYRVIYEIEDDRLVVLVVALGHRGNVYRNL